MTTPTQGLPPPARDARQFVVALVDTLDSDFDADEFVAGCVVLLDVAAAGLLLADPRGNLQAAAYHGEPARALIAAELARGDGPSVECHRTGQPGSYPTTSVLLSRWPDLTGTADHAGITALCAVPMRRRDDAVGVLTLLGSRQHHVAPDTLQLARSLTEAATIGLLNQRTIRRHERTAAQLQTALTSRLVIEQAKGILAGRLDITVDAAFALLRGYARAHNRNLRELAEEVTSGGHAIGADGR